MMNYGYSRRVKIDERADVKQNYTLYISLGTTLDSLDNRH